MDCLSCGRERVFGLRVCEAFASPPPSPSPPRNWRLALLPARQQDATWIGVVTRYRSATVADFHGLPRRSPPKFFNSLACLANAAIACRLNGTRSFLFRRGCALNG